MTNHSTVFLAGASIIALMTPMKALAQTGAANAAEQSERDGLQDIIVTAQRRLEKQQDVPIAISSVSAELAAQTGVTSTETLSVAVPGLQFGRQTSNGGAPFLRGVGSTQAAAGSESPVAVYIDDVYIGAPASTTFSFNNIAQIDVLKGPQGTLFGRNATGGVVQIRTKRPSHDAAVDGRLGYGNFDTLEGSVYGTSGLTDNLAVNIAATGRHQGDGYGRNVNTGQGVNIQSYWGTRGEALWEPGETTSLLLIADYAKATGDAGLAVSVAPGTVASGGATFAGRYNSTAFPRNWSSNEQYGFSGRLDQDLGAVRLASITAYRKSNLEFNVDNDASRPAVNANNAKALVSTFSQELQILAPTGSKLQWIAGLFYYHARAGYDPLEVVGSAVASSGGRTRLRSFQVLDSYAGFGEASYELLPETKLTLGLRYTSDHFSINATRANAAGVAGAGFPISDSSTFSKLTYRAVVDHHFSRDIMAYASFSRGFKSGGYNVTAPSVTVAGVARAAPPVEPEVLDAYEIGLKSELLDRKLRLNLAAYHYDYTNLQQTVVGIGTSTTVNAAAARINGLDFDFELHPIRDLTISGGGAIIDAKYTSFPNGPLLVPSPAVCTPVPRTTGPLSGGNTTCAADLAGNRIPRAAKFTGSLTATYNVPTSVGEFVLSGSVYHNSGYAWDPDNRIRQPEYTLLNARLTWTSLDQKYEVSVWGKNLTDKYYLAYASGSASRDGLIADAPRTYGVTAGFHF